MRRVVPTHFDLTNYKALNSLKHLNYEGEL